MRFELTAGQNLGNSDLLGPLCRAALFRRGSERIGRTRAETIQSGTWYLQLLCAVSN